MRLVACLLAGCTLAWLPAAAAADRTRVGLVLGGGGARGAAHIGVLEVLEQLHVPVDCVAGTSFGALVAGAWAAGVAPAEMRAAMAGADWADMFQDNPDYTELNYRTKRLSQRYLPGSESGLGANGVTYPPGLVSGQKIKLFINQLVRADRGEPDIARLPMPLAIVATDIGTGERVVFRRGSLTRAMRASMSVPGLMAPVADGGRRLVDGGLVDNLPVQEVRDLCGAQVVIAVNVASPLLPPDQVGSLLTVSAQMVALLTEQNVTRSLQLLGPEDVYIKPALQGIGSGDFVRHDDAIASGREAAGQATARLRALAVDDAAWQRWQVARAGADRPTPFVQAVQVQGLSRADPDVVKRYLHQQPDEPLDAATLDRDLMRAYGDGWYESVDYSLVTVRDRNILRILPVEKPWGPNYLRLAVNLNSTLDQGTSYSLRAGYQRTWLNRLGGELLLGAEIGSRPALTAEWYQPLQDTQRWFTQVDLGLSSDFRDLYENDRLRARYRVYRGVAEFALGVNWQLQGQLRAGWRVSRTRIEPEIGDPVLPPDTTRASGALLSLDLDRLNRLYFPTDGWALQAGYFHDRQGQYSRLAAEFRGAHSFGPWVLATRVSFTGSPQGQLPLTDAATVGGFLNLSAYGSGQFVADTVRYAHLRAERIVGRLPLGLRGDMRLGVALEGARLGRPFTVDDRAGALDSLALYLGGETPFGPAYVGFGQSSQGSRNAYFFLGTP
jgi:NTE family protein